MTFTIVLYKMETMGVTLSFAPSSAAWRTPPMSDVGMESARI